MSTTPTLNTAYPVSSYPGATVTVLSVASKRGLADKITFDVRCRYDYPDAAPEESRFGLVGSVYGSPGPIVLVQPGGGQTHVADAGRFGEVLDRNYAVRYATDQEI